MHNFEEDIGYSFIQLIKVHRRRAEEGLAPLKLHIAQDLVLFVLQRKDGLSQSELADALQLELPSVTKSVKRMEQSGLVIRTSDSVDRRISRVYLTESGRSLYPAAMESWMRVESRMTKDMSDVERMLFHRLLKQAVESLSD